MKNSLYIILFLHTVVFAGDWKDSRYFNTAFLRQPDKVRESLIQDEQFEKGDFNTQDNVRIHYLWKKRPNAKKTLICCGGYSPGKKEGLASLYPMMPEDTNILFFDARGHGQSNGGSFKLWRYGLDEYQDIVAAIEYAQKKDNCPIMIWSTCSGSFNATHAIRHLAQEEKLQNVKGMICDGGWASLATASYSAPVSGARDFITAYIKSCLGKNKVSNALSYGCAQLSKLCLRTIYYCVWSPLSAAHEQTTTLFGKMGDFPIPVLFIHGIHDTYVNIEETKRLAKEAPNSQTWWVTKPSKHACILLQHKEEYRDHVLDFMNGALQEETSAI